MESAERFCPQCGRPVAEGAAFCASCGKSLSSSAAPPPPPKDDGIATLVPYRNMPALIGYYLGVFSLIPCLGLPLGIAAVVCGIFGLKKNQKEPTAKGKAHAWVAIVLGALTTLAWGGAGIWLLVVAK